MEQQPSEIMDVLNGQHVPSSQRQACQMKHANTHTGLEGHGCDRDSGVSFEILKVLIEYVPEPIFGAFCLDVRTVTFCQLMDFPLNH